MTVAARCVGITVIGAIATTCAYVWADLPVAYFIHEHSSVQLGSIGRFLDELGKSHWFLIANAIIIIATWRAARETAYTHIVFFASIALSGIVSNIIKVGVNRARPPLLFSDGVYGFTPLAFSVDYLHSSFPSGHATTGFALLVAGYVLRPNARWIFVAVGIAIASGRILYNVHYVSDVVAGATIGTVVTLAVFHFMQKHKK